jgi:transcriptional regulator
MYIPAHFAAGPDAVRDLLTSPAAANLITATPQGILATFLPWVYEPSIGDHGALHGHLARNNPQWLGEQVRRLTTLHEAGSDRPWTVEDAPERYVAGRLRTILGVELLIARIEAKTKLSQNRPDADIDGVIAGLAVRGQAESAADAERARRGR